jgi:hypothetical protein
MKIKFQFSNTSNWKYCYSLIYNNLIYVMISVQNITVVVTKLFHYIFKYVNSRNKKLQFNKEINL